MPVSKWESNNRNDVLEDLARGKHEGRYKDCAHLTFFEASGMLFGDAYRYATYCDKDSLLMPSQGGHLAAAAIGLRGTPLREPRCPDGCHSFEPTPERKKVAEVERLRDEAITAIDAQITALDRILSDHAQPNFPGYDRPRVSSIMKESLERWVSTTRRILKEKVKESEATKFAEKSRGLRGDSERGAERCKAFFDVLKQELIANPEAYFSPSAPVDPMTKPSTPAEQVVFIVHGHDETNKLKLDQLLKNEFKLKTIILSAIPGKSRTIIEKFEDEASAATFAIVLLTPDDLVRKDDESYLQSRPNVLFELGWFCGKLKRRNTLLLWRGGELPSDLRGVEWVPFQTSVDEAFLRIRQELAAAGIIDEPK